MQYIARWRHPTFHPRSQHCIVAKPNTIEPICTSCFNIQHVDKTGRGVMALKQPVPHQSKTQTWTVIPLLFIVRNCFMSNRIWFHAIPTLPAQHLSQHTTGGATHNKSLTVGELHKRWDTNAKTTYIVCVGPWRTLHRSIYMDTCGDSCRYTYGW